ncbi:hypothetical protein, partial [Novosphingobium malaysiense]
MYSSNLTMVGGACLAVMLVTACGGSSEPAAEPTSYHIQKEALYASTTTDICRAKDAAFLRNLLLRVSSVLPEGTSGFDFVDFDVTGMSEDENARAVIRFRAVPSGEQPEAMYAVGSFRPEDCIIGPLQG